MIECTCLQNINLFFAKLKPHLELKKMNIMKSPSWYPSYDAPQMTYTKDENHKGQTNKIHLPLPFPKKKKLTGQCQWEGLMQYSSLFDIFAMANSGKFCQEKTSMSWPHTLATTKIREIFLTDFSRAMLQDC